MFTDADDVAAIERMDGTERGTFEWVAGWEHLAPLLAPGALGLQPSAHVVDVGCGDSTLPLHLAAHYERVTAMDREAHCTASMSAQYGSDHENVHWMTCDVCDAHALAAAFPQGEAGLVVDKGMLDCAIVEHDAARLLCNVATQLLAPNGVYLVISFRKPALLVPLLSCPELPWEVTHTPLLLSDGEQPASVCTMRRLPPPIATGRAAPDVVGVAQHIEATLDKWYREEDPLLTADREQTLRRNWQLAATSFSDGQLPVRVAWELILTDDEREELPLGDFADDVAAFLDKLEGVVDGRWAPGASLDATISLEQALQYLQDTQ